MGWANKRMERISTVNGQRSIVKETKSQRDKERKSQREEETKRGRDEERKRRRDEETKRGREYLSLEGYTPAKMEAGAAAPKEQFILMITG